ncbi:MULTISPECIES: hypothetical protein [unclassified Coleofasciculus]|uniref:hypothetical protein n=1 Tax=unclassified Coleofasciculus TaxID=2692782 RepID=UPI001882D111|nr:MULTISPECIES: hypothetical protein [unclassified Coleofasciculus]MBE9129734.1 hypothetical protein [Coleofasciculus sp. LEGE 07081]MBE9151151.1 hypothetical protein [Coleofasciculus sp. LEGE 07092]
MILSPGRADFGFKIEFARDTEDPSRVFRALSKLIDFCQFTDKNLIKTLDIELEPDLLLEDIQPGSIILWLKNIFKSENETTIKNFNIKAIIVFLVESKSSIINFINKRSTINSTSELLDLKNKIKSLAEKTDVKKLGIYTPPTDKDLLSSIDKLQSASSELQEADQLYYLFGSSNWLINRDFSISSDSRENLLVEETVRSESKMILKVKKPDLLGASKWEFKHGKKTIDAKINDLEWLKKFKQGEITLASGYAVKAQVEIVTQYDSQGELISIQHTIQKVLAVIPAPPDNQLSLFKDQNLGS